MIEIQQHIEHDELMTMLPHKGKMFLLSRVTQHDSENHTITSEYDITKDCIFYEEEADGVPSWAGFEFMAQSISALTGITNKKRGREPLPGFLLSVSEFKTDTDFFRNNTTIRMRVEEDYREESDHIYRYNCYIFPSFSQDPDSDIASPLATAKITVMETEDIHMLFKD